MLGILKNTCDQMPMARIRMLRMGTDLVPMLPMGAMAVATTCRLQRTAVS